MVKKSFYVADFYCHSLSLVVEIDGSIHKLKKREDLIRDGIMGMYGLNVFRLKAEDVIYQKKDILKKLETFLDYRINTALKEIYNRKPPPFLRKEPVFVIFLKGIPVTKSLPFLRGRFRGIQSQLV